MILRCVADRSAPLRDVLRRELGLSSTQLRRGRDREAFRINGAPAFLNAPVRPGDTVTALLEEAPPSFPAEDGPLDVLYEDEALIVLNKPAGLTSEEGVPALLRTLWGKPEAYVGGGPPAGHWGVGADGLRQNSSRRSSPGPSDHPEPAGLHPA